MILDQAIGTWILGIVILGVTDKNNISPESNIAPIIIGLCVTVCSLSFGITSG